MENNIKITGDLSKINESQIIGRIKVVMILTDFKTKKELNLTKADLNKIDSHIKFLSNTAFKKFDFKTKAAGYTVDVVFKKGTPQLQQKLGEIFQFINKVLGKKTVKNTKTFAVSSPYNELKINTKPITVNRKIGTPRVIHKNLHHKIMTILCRELYLSSNLDKKADSYARGNGLELLRTNEQRNGYSMLRIKPHQLYKAIYPNKKTISGIQIKRIKQALIELNKTLYPIITQSNLNGKIRHHVREQQLITVTASFDSKNQNSDSIINGGLDSILNDNIQKNNLELTITFHPIFTKDIAKRFILFPVDIIQRMEQHTKGTLKDYQYLMRDLLYQYLSGKTYKFEIGEKLFYKKLNIHKKRKNRINQAVEVAFKTFTDMGLIDNYNLVDAKQGGCKFVISMNKDYK